MPSKIRVINVSRRLNSYDFIVQLPVPGTNQILFKKDHAPRAKALIAGFLMRDGLTYEAALEESDSLLARVICQLNN